MRDKLVEDIRIKINEGVKEGRFSKASELIVITLGLGLFL